MKKYKFLKIASVIAVVLLTIPVKNIKAIPAFARKYQISCQVCHSPAFPRLKAFGDEFAGNGFRMTEYKSPRYLIKTGDDRLSLLRELPLAVRIDGFASYNFDNQERSDFSAPYVVKILSGGEISDKISYYFYFLFNERGAVGGVEDAFIFYSDILRSGINLTAGQFQASDPLFKSELRYTLEPYTVYGVSPGNSSVSLKYERGIMVDKEFKTGTLLLGGVFNGSGIRAAGGDLLFDKDKYKNFMGRISQSIGKHLSIGFMGYTGKEVLLETPAPLTNEVLMFGPDLAFDFDEKIVINAQFIRRTDSQVYLSETNLAVPDVMTSGGFAEVIYSPKGDMSNWYLTGLFNWIESDIAGLDYKSATLHAGYMLRRNLRIVSEYTHQFSGQSYGKVNVGMVTAF